MKHLIERHLLHWERGGSRIP